MAKVKYKEPDGFIPEDIRKELKLGEYADETDIEEYRKRIALLDWENERKYCESVIKSDMASEENKKHARRRVKEAEAWIKKIKAMD